MLPLSLCLFSIPRLLSCSDYDDSIATTSYSLKRRANKKETASATLPFATVRKTSEDCHSKVPTTLETIQLIHPRTVPLSPSVCVYCSLPFFFRIVNCAVKPNRNTMLAPISTRLVVVVAVVLAVIAGTGRLHAAKLSATSTEQPGK